MYRTLYGVRFQAFSVDNFPPLGSFADICFNLRVRFKF